MLNIDGENISDGFKKTQIQDQRMQNRAVKLKKIVTDMSRAYIIYVDLEKPRNKQGLCEHCTHPLPASSNWLH